MARTQVAQVPPPPAAASTDALPTTVVQAVPTEQLSLDEMIRIMDVASTLRKEQAVVEQQLNIEETKAMLRERLLAAAQVTGERLTIEQVDIAIEHYYDKLHLFEEPKWSFSVFLAHLYVRRTAIITWIVGSAAALAAAWSFFG